MSLLKQFITETQDKFDDEWRHRHWGYNIEGSEREYYTNERKEEIKSYLSSSLKEFAALIKKEVEGMEMENNYSTAYGDYTEEKAREHQNYIVGYNLALEHILSLLDLTD